MRFNDYLHPTNDELRQWAYLPNPEFPEEISQDWELCFNDFDHAPVLLELASDANCPTRTFFLSSLYLLVGDCVRNEVGRKRIPDAEAFLAGVTGQLPDDVATWLARSRQLLNHPEMFDYKKWCLGGYAYGINFDDDDRIHPTRKFLKASQYLILVLFAIGIVAMVLVRWSGPVGKN